MSSALPERWHPGLSGLLAQRISEKPATAWVNVRTSTQCRMDRFTRLEISFRNKNLEPTVVIMRSLILASAVALLATTATYAAASPHTALSVDACAYSEADLEANRLLDWASFDQSGKAPKSSMWLSSKGCYREAVDVARDYLANGPFLTIRQHAITTFHMARNLARTGDHRGASLLAAASRRSDQPAEAPLDWNTYVVGFTAYLSGDRARLDDSHARLLAAGGEANLINAGVLARAQRCFTRPYAEVETAPDCLPAVK